MTTLTLDPLASLLARLFDEADASSPATAPDFASLSRDEQAQLMRSKTDYTDLYARLKDYPLAVSRETGTLLYMLARSGARGRSSNSARRSAFRRCTSRRAARQRRRPAGHERVRAVEGRAPGRTWRQPGWPISSRFARAMRCVRWPPICRIRSTCCCSTVRRRCIRRCLHSSSNGCGPARSSLPTMPISAPTISLTCARRRTAICRCRSATMSSCRCGSAELCGI